MYTSTLTNFYTIVSYEDRFLALLSSAQAWAAEALLTSDSFQECYYAVFVLVRDIVCLG